MAKNNKEVARLPELEYVMPYGCYKELTDEAPDNVNKKDWVIDYINLTYGLLGTVTKLTIA